MIRSPVCFLLSPVLILMISHVTTSTNCPDPSRDEWKTKNAEECTPGTKYHCQYDGGTNLITDMCAEPVTCTEGTHALLDHSTKTVSCVPCSHDMYQPTSKSSYEFTQPNCDYRKTPCKPELGELECGEPTSSQNYQCKCDYTKEFKPILIENKCDCFVKDSSSCECAEAGCKEGEVLAANYSCIVNGSTTPPSKTVSATPLKTVSTTQMPSHLSPGGIAGAVVGSAICLGIIVLVVVCIVRKRICPSPSDAETNVSQQEENREQDRRQKNWGESKSLIQGGDDDERSGDIKPQDTSQPGGPSFNATAARNSEATNALAVGEQRGNNIFFKDCHGVNLHVGSTEA